MPNSITELISCWIHLAPFNFSKKNLLKLACMWTPKFLYWKVWLERNNRIFKEESRLPSQVAIKARTMLSEALSTKSTIRNETTISPEEDRWFKELNLNQQSYKAIKPPQKAKWEIRLEEQEFIKWRSALDEWCLFFDGASKGNPVQAGGGGIIFEPSGNPHLSYAWGLRHASNNQAEYLALWKGLNQARKLNIKKLTIFGDSRLIVKALYTKKMPTDINLAHMHRKVLLLLTHFRTHKAYHVLRNLKNLADAEANRGMTLSKSQLIVNGEISNHPLP